MLRLPRTRPARLGLYLLGFAIVVAAAVAACELAGWRFLRDPLEQALSRRLERPVHLSPPFRLHLLGGVRVQAHRLRIAAPPGFAVPHFVDAEDLGLRLRYRDLWSARESGSLRVAGLAVERIDIQLLRHPNGDVTWRTGKPSAGRTPPLPAVDSLVVRAGRLYLHDPTLGADLRAAFDTEGSGGAAAPISHLQAQGEFRDRPLQGRMTIQGWLPMTGEAEAPLQAKGWLVYGGIRAEFHGELADVFTARGAKGNFVVSGPSLSLVGRLFDTPLPTTPAFVLQGSMGKQAGAWRFDVASARIGDSRLQGHLNFDPHPEPPRLEGEISGRNLALADLAPAFGTRNEDGTPVRPSPGRVLPNRRLDLPSLRKMDARIRFDLQRLDLGSAFAQPITPFKAALSLDGGKLALSDIVARTASGRLSGGVAIDTRPNPPQWRFDLGWDDIRLEEWLKTATARKPEASAPARSNPPYFTGTLHGRARLAGSGHSTAQLLASLGGEATVFVRDATFSHLLVEILGLDLAQGLGLMLAGDKSLPVQCAVIDVQAKRGLLTPRVALVDTPVTLVLGDGSVDLGNERLNLRLSARPKNVSPFTVRSPIRVRGSFENPAIAPEGGPIAIRVLGGIALAAVNPLAAIIPFIDPGDRVDSPCRQSLAALRS